jgi:hypothetical protein
MMVVIAITLAFLTGCAAPDSSWSFSAARLTELSAAEQRAVRDGNELLLLKERTCRDGTASGKVKNLRETPYHARVTVRFQIQEGASPEISSAALDLAPGEVTEYTVKRPPGPRPRPEELCSTSFHFDYHGGRQLRVYEE